MQTFLIISNILLWLALLFVLLLVLSLIRRLNDQPGTTSDTTDSLALGMTFPDVRLEALSGRQTTIPHAEHTQEAVVFVSANCGSCQDTLRELDDLYPVTQQAGVDLKVVSIDGREATEAFIHDLDLQFPVYITAENTADLLSRYKILGTPFHYFLQDGTVASGGFLDRGWEQLTHMWYGSSSHDG